ncbi:MAG: hypothetical protein ACREDF_06575, partial [Thermoplasmata archaeon]
ALKSRRSVERRVRRGIVRGIRARLRASRPAASDTNRAGHEVRRPLTPSRVLEAGLLYRAVP